MSFSNRDGSPYSHHKAAFEWLDVEATPVERHFLDLSGRPLRMAPEHAELPEQFPGVIEVASSSLAPIPISQAFIQQEPVL